MRIVWADLGIHVSSGGRNVANLTRMWADQGHDVTLITLAAQATDVYPVDHRVRRIELTPMRGHFRVWKHFTPTREWARVGALRRAIRTAEPDVVLSNWNVMNVRTLLATPPTVPVVIVDHKEYEAFSPLDSRWRRLRRQMYPRARVAVVPNPDEARWMASFVPSDRIFVVPAMLDLRPPSPPARRTRTLLAAGRLLPFKGFDLLLDAFARSRARTGGWTLRVLGDGPERHPLEARAEALGIAALVTFPGRTEEIWDEYATAGVFILSSHADAAPAVLAESMAAGLPVISTDCPTGPRHIVRAGINGLLVPPGDAGALATAIDRLAADPGLRERLGSRATEVAERYAPERVGARWREILETCAERRS